MREMKFRSWNKKWDSMKYDILGIANQAICCDEVIHISYLQKDETILMQYTGLKDKNGREIYEGDLVRSNLYSNENYEFVGRVAFENAAFIIQPKDRGCQLLFAHDDSDLEIIGNIYGKS